MSWQTQLRGDSVSWQRRRRLGYGVQPSFRSDNLQSTPTAPTLSPTSAAGRWARTNWQGRDSLRQIRPRRGGVYGFRPLCLEVFDITSAAQARLRSHRFGGRQRIWEKFSWP